MTFIQLIIPVEFAHHAITYLGQLGLLQLHDVLISLNRYLQCIEDLRQTLPEDRRNLPLSQEQNERMHVVGGPMRPPRPPQSLLISHGVYGRDMTKDPSSDEDDKDYYVDNAPLRC
ncbi:hypothetical protein CQW23_19773 [Capsicum baccatum]|uniref:Uncharacterized protein n=1 Tax=Capsicum baccatum TaxID=33114 RepID=A0A2G2W6U9_CAPBA|nr:hypothetical protein CQW23_19773 [Capsicum baccatum]